jgi:hypothetical protein
MDAVTEANRLAWEAASRKHVREYEDLLAQAASGALLNAVERALLSDILDGAPEVVHLQSGHGLEDAALVQAGAKAVIGIDYSGTAAGAAQQRANELGVRAGQEHTFVAGVLVYLGRPLYPACTRDVPGRFSADPGACSQVADEDGGAACRTWAGMPGESLHLLRRAPARMTAGPAVTARQAPRRCGSMPGWARRP